MRRPNCLPTSPTPSAPALMSARSCCNRLVRPARADVAEVDAGEHAEAILVRRRVDRRDRLDQAVAADVVGERQDPQVERIHRLDEPLHRVLGELSLVAVNVDDGELRLRHLVFDGDQRALRPVVENARRRRVTAPGSCPAATSVVPGGHSWPAAMRVPPPRCAASPAPTTPLRMMTMRLFLNMTPTIVERPENDRRTAVER